MSLWVPLLLLGVLAVLPGHASRLRAVVPRPKPAAGAAEQGSLRALAALGTAKLRREDLLALAGGAAVAAVSGGALGVCVGAALTAAGMWGARRWAGRAVPDDPLAVAGALDLLAACLQAGLAVPDAAVAAAQVCDPGPPHDAEGDRRTVAPAAPTGAAPRLGVALRRVADLLALGGDPTDAWEVLAGEPGLEPLARLARRSADSGSSLAGEAGRLAEAFRARAADTAVASAEKAGVAIAGPLGVCFLPAFVCLGIAPVIVGLAGDILGGGPGAG
nr:type II secretion system F family protein [Tomitella gaofuii]